MSAFLNRPDHLTHAGRELARWNEILALAGEARVPASVVVREVRAGSEAPGTFLSSQADAARVTAVVLYLVQRTRH